MKFLKKKIKESEETLLALNSAIQQAENKLIMLNNKLKKKDNLSCPICFENKINITLIPCGHCFCSNCIQSSSNCYFCRKQIQSKHKIFLN